MATIVQNSPEIMRRTRELEVETHRDKARFAGWLITILVIVAASLALGLASSAW